MYASVRRYTGLGPGMFEELDRRRADLEAWVRTFPGLVQWYLFRTPDGMTTITLSRDQAGADASVRLAADWIKANMPSFMPQPPEVSSGEVTLQVTG